MSGGGLPTWVHLLIGLLLPLYVLGMNMWHVRSFTIDDSYISFRYARNLADGLGLVYNAGERIEGYTNFSFTLLLAAGFKLGIDPHLVAKSIGAISALATVYLLYREAPRFLPLGTSPPLAPVLLASSAVFSGYAVYGLETTFFTFLIVAGISLSWREEDTNARFPWSGVVFGIAGLSRPEAPLFVGLTLLIAGRPMFSRRNWTRAFLFVIPVALHVLWRHSYYGEWLPATLGAKTGDFRQQWNGGRHYIVDYVKHAGPIVFLGLYGAALSIVRKHREGLLILAITVAWGGYILLVGGDWMPFFRFIAPVEPFLYLLVGLGLRQIIEFRSAAANLALLVFCIIAMTLRIEHLAQAQHQLVHKDKKFWDSAAGQAADWMVRHGRYGTIAIGDIGYVGYRTNFPILDLLGLVDPVIAKLPGGYTRKLGPGFVARFYEVMPAYAIIIMSGQQCKTAHMVGSKQLSEDPRFFRNYFVAHNIQVNPGASWCIFQRKDH